MSPWLCPWPLFHSFTGYPFRLLTDTLLGRFVVHPSRKKAITLPLVPFSWGSTVYACLSAQTVIRYDIVNCITADEHMLGYACRVENTNDCVCNRCIYGSCSFCFFFSAFFLRDFQWGWRTVALQLHRDICPSRETADQERTFFCLSWWQ